MGRTIRKAKLFTTMTILLKMSQKWLFSLLTSFFELACWVIECMTKNSSSFNPGSLIFSSLSSSESLDRFAFPLCLFFFFTSLSRCSTFFVSRKPLVSLTLFALTRSTTTACAHTGTVFVDALAPAFVVP